MLVTIYSLSLFLFLFFVALLLGRSASDAVVLLPKKEPDQTQPQTILPEHKTLDCPVKAAGGRLATRY